MPKPVLTATFPEGIKRKRTFKTFVSYYIDDFIVNKGKIELKYGLCLDQGMYIFSDLCIERKYFKNGFFEEVYNTIEDTLEKNSLLVEAIYRVI